MDSAWPGKSNTSFKNLPFLFITARSLKQDKIKAYELGAEDYIIKPFDADELACKMRVILRRVPSGSAANLPEKLELGKYTFYTSRQELCLDGKANKLTEKESQILLLLCQQQNKILRREEAVTSVYGKFDYFLGRSFDVFISRLRKLLREDPDIQIDNVFKVGFIMRINSTIQI